MNCFQKQAKEKGKAAADDKGNQICFNTAGNNAGAEDSALKYSLWSKSVAA